MTAEIPNEHRRRAAKRLSVAIVTVSDSRTLENDEGGKLIERMLQESDHSIVLRSIVKDELELIRSTVKRILDDPNCEAVLVTGGTGLAARDVTVEAIEALYDALIPGYGELFRYLSYCDIGSAALLSRASGGRVGTKIVLTMPGSPAGVRLAMEKLILPELPHMVHHAGK